MSDLIGLFSLIAPFFGLIGLGIVSARLARLPEGGLAWMQFFIVYLALPCLFFRLLSGKPIDELLNWSFVAVTTLSTATAFCLSFGAGLRCGFRLPETIMGAVAGSYSNIGYMGPPSRRVRARAGGERARGPRVRLRHDLPVLDPAGPDGGGGGGIPASARGRRPRAAQGLHPPLSSWRRWSGFWRALCAGGLRPFSTR